MQMMGLCDALDRRHAWSASYPTVHPVETSLTGLLALVLAACGGSSLEDRIRSVETGLVEEYSTPGWGGMTLTDRMAYHRVPGLSLAVIDGFEISWAKGYGSRRADRDEPVTSETLFQTASIGKPVVAVTTLRLVQAGSLDLDEDVNARLRSWRVPENEFTARAPVTLRRLLSHSAGTTVHGFRGYEGGAPLPTLLQILDGQPPANSPPIRVDAEPGEYRYSNGGYMIVQALLTDVTGQPFTDLVDESVFAGLGMKDSLFDPLPQNRWNRAASGHRSDGQPLPGGWHVYPEAGAGPFWSTPPDMARFGIELMRSHEGKSDRMLSQALAREMFTPQTGGFGLGIGVDDDGGNRLYAMHAGATEGFRSLLVFYAKRGQGAVIMTNGDGGELLAEELLRSLSREYGWVPGLTLEIWMLVVIGGVAAFIAGWVMLARKRRGTDLTQ